LYGRLIHVFFRGAKAAASVAPKAAKASHISFYCVVGHGFAAAGELVQQYRAHSGQEPQGDDAALAVEIRQLRRGTPNGHDDAVQEIVAVAFQNKSVILLWTP
jgi:hypothetical protein